MHTFTSTALAALLLASGALSPTADFHWQRTISVIPGRAGQQACIILDADVFSHTEPGLTDLRLFQDGQELPYAVEESFDQRALEYDTVPPDDRSIYEVALRAPLLRTMLGVFSGDPKSIDAPVKGSTTADWVASMELPRHVPVERIRIEPAPNGRESIEVSAGPLTHPGQMENISGLLTAGNQALPVTLGANLQEEARVHISVFEADHAVNSVVLEMRRRSLCFQPRSASPITLFLGNPGLSAPVYDFAGHFSSASSQTLATMGTLLPNPEFGSRPQTESGLSHMQRLEIVALFFAAMVLFYAKRIVRKKVGLHR